MSVRGSHRSRLSVMPSLDSPPLPNSPHVPYMLTKQFQDDKMQLDNPQETVELIKHGEIDESFYSRQLYAGLRLLGVA